MPKTIQSKNPFSGEINWEFELFSQEKILEIIKTADKAYTSWKQTSFAEKKVLFESLADVIDNRREELAKIQTIEMWMLYTDSVAGLEWTAKLIRWFASNAERVLGEEEFDYGEWI